MIFRDEAVALLGKLVEIPSVYFDEDNILHWMNNWFLKEGLSPRIHEYNEDKITNFEGKNLIVELEGQSEGLYIYLNAHVDTVQVANGWTKKPFAGTLDGDKLYGLGSLDMKSGVASTMLALAHFYHKHKDFSGKITSHFVSDEEGPFGLGTTFLIHDDLVKHQDIAIVAEPSAGFSGLAHPCVCLGARGGYNYTIRFFGKAAHAATPELGTSAIVDSSRVIMALEEIPLIQDPNLGKGSSVVIRTSGGGAACSVADYAEVEVFRHVVNGETKDTILAEVEKAIQGLNIKSRYEIQFRESPAAGFDGGFLAYYYKDNPLIDDFKLCVEDICGKKPLETFFTSIGDFNHIGGMLGIPTVIFGPDGRDFHSPDEYVLIDSVVDVANTILLFLEKNLVK